MHEYFEMAAEVIRLAGFVIDDRELHLLFLSVLRFPWHGHTTAIRAIDRALFHLRADHLIWTVDIQTSHTGIQTLQTRTCRDRGHTRQSEWSRMHSAQRLSLRPCV